MYCYICDIDVDIPTEEFSHKHIWSKHRIKKHEYYDTYIKTELDGKCKVCGKPTSFISLINGYKTYCSSACVARCPDAKKKAADSIKERYGDEHPNMNPLVRSNLRDYMKTDEYRLNQKLGVKKSRDERGSEIDSKRNNTNISKYGVSSPSKLDIVKNQAKITNKARYNVEWTSQVDEFKEKKHNTCLTKYGVKTPLMLRSVIEKIKNNRRKKNWDVLVKRSTICRFELLFSQDDYLNISFDKFKYKCLDCNKEWHEQDDAPTYANCPHCFISRSKYEDEIISELVLMGVDRNRIESNVTKVINGKKISLDIYIDDIKLAIDFHGLYWHSHLHQSDTSHVKRKELAEKNGIDLIQVIEPLWRLKKDIICNIIRHRLKFDSQRIGARKCEIRLVSKSEYKNFVEKYHSQGYVNSSIVLGLYYNNKLVALASFGKSRFKKGDAELHRYVQLPSTTIIGGLRRLCISYMKQYNVTELKTYCEKLLFNGYGYKAAGFIYSHDSKQNYFYFRNGSLQLHSRFKFQKHKLKTILPIYDDSLTEIQNMNNNGWLHIFDAGNRVYTFTLK